MPSKAANFKDENDSVVVYVGSPLTVHIPLFLIINCDCISKCDVFVDQEPVYMEVGDPRQVRLHVTGHPTYHVNLIKSK